MYTALIIIDVLLAIALIALVMLQQGKGADAGAAFGSGSSGTVFGAAGGASTIAKITTWIAVAFFAVTLGLSLVAKQRVAEATAPTQKPTSIVEEKLSSQAIPEQFVPQVPEEAVPEVPAGADEIPVALPETAPVDNPVVSDEVPSVDDIPSGAGDRQGG